MRHRGRERERAWCGNASACQCDEGVAAAAWRGRGEPGQATHYRLRQATRALQGCWGYGEGEGGWQRRASKEDGVV